MARFIELTSPDGENKYIVNADKITFMQDGAATRETHAYTRLHFDKDHGLNVAGPAATIASKAK